jgi:hypothetical protein
METSSELPAGVRGERRKPRLNPPIRDLCRAAEHSPAIEMKPRRGVSRHAFA